jgi:hypothetical protein
MMVVRRRYPSYIIWQSAREFGQTQHTGAKNVRTSKHNPTLFFQMLSCHFENLDVHLMYRTVASYEKKKGAK